jgi:TIR domain-containing protein
MAETHDIFLSYSQRDTTIAAYLASQLKAAGISCFMAASDIEAGEVWEDTIRSTLKAARRILLLLTPRSKNSLWVAAEAGAAWALEKDLIAALMFVEATELIDPIKRHQARLVETPEQVMALVNELTTTRRFASDKIEGQWLDPTDNETVFFKQRGSRVVGFYDFGSGKRKVGMYVGSLNGQKFDYQWKWLNGQMAGHGQMTLSGDGKKLSGTWWFKGKKSEAEFTEYHRVSDEMPKWLSADDFTEFSRHFKTRGTT